MKGIEFAILTALLLGGWLITTEKPRCRDHSPFASGPTLEPHGGFHSPPWKPGDGPPP